MRSDYRFYGWQLSYFAGKLRGYMNYKQLNFVEKDPGYFDLMHRFPRLVGSSSMPVVETRQGEWLSDTTEVIDTLEKRHPKHSIFIPGPRQRIIAMLLEAWFDDFWITPAMYTRWMYPESYALFQKEGGKAMLPFLPVFVRNFVVQKTAMSSLRSYLPGMGITEKQAPLIDKWLRQQLLVLEEHFSQHRYLLGGRPTIADYGLLGPMYGHLNRDPWPKKELLDKLPHLQSWVERTHSGVIEEGDLVQEDQIPNSLLPLLGTIAREFVPMLHNTVTKTGEIIEKRQLQVGDTLPRQYKDMSILLGAEMFNRNTFSYTLWMMQRIQDEYNQLSQADQIKIDKLLEKLAMPKLMKRYFGPRLCRHGLGVKLS